MSFEWRYSAVTPDITEHKIKLTLQNSIFHIPFNRKPFAGTYIFECDVFTVEKKVVDISFSFSHFVLAGILYLNVVSLMMKSTSTSPSVLIRDVGITISCCGSSGIFFNMRGVFSFSRVEAFVPAHPPIFPVLMFILPLKQRAVPPALFPICIA